MHLNTVSVIIPIKDEAKNIEPLAKELREVLDQQVWHWECIWVDDENSIKDLIFCLLYKEHFSL